MHRSKGGSGDLQQGGECDGGGWGIPAALVVQAKMCLRDPIFGFV